MVLHVQSSCCYSHNITCMYLSLIIVQIIKQLAKHRYMPIKRDLGSEQLHGLPVCKQHSISPVAQGVHGQWKMCARLHQ